MCSGAASQAARPWLSSARTDSRLSRPDFAAVLAEAAVIRSLDTYVGLPGPFRACEPSRRALLPAPAL
jgi:hypothetical protein